MQKDNVKKSGVEEDIEEAKTRAIESTIEFSKHLSEEDRRKLIKISEAFFEYGFSLGAHETYVEILSDLTEKIKT
jgi:hypothetical protein